MSCIKMPVVLAWAAKIKCHKQGGINNRDLFLTALETGVSELGVSMTVFMRALPDLQMLPSPYILM
jgi:hypothetical protein